jgi:thioredoxin-related protein
MEEFKDIIFENVDVDDGDHEIEIEKLQIKSVPTTILLDENNEPIYKLMGNVPKSDLVNLINQCLNDR